MSDKQTVWILFRMEHADWERYDTVIAVYATEKEADGEAWRLHNVTGHDYWCDEYEVKDGDA